MDSILLKAKKDYFRYNNRPHISDIFTNLGFLKYFFYRTSMPFIRDIFFILVDTLEIYLLYMYFGRKVSTGGIFAYATSLISLNIWQIIIYSLREKLLVTRKTQKHIELSYYLVPYFVLGILIWLLSNLTFFYIIPFKNELARLVFINKNLSNIFTFISIAYFFTAYSISRIYIPFFATILTKLSSLLVIILSFKFIGIYAFILGFYLEKLLSFFVMVVFINKIYRKRRINPFKPTPSMKVFFSKLKELSLRKTVFRFLSFSLYSLQTLLIILFVKLYDANYLLEFFLFFQTLRFLILPAKRIAKSLFYDLSILTITGDFNLKHRLLKMDFIVLILVSVVTSSIFYFLVYYGFYPHRFSRLVFEIYMIGGLKIFAYFIFLKSIITVLKRIFLILEAHIVLDIAIITFELLLPFYLLFDGILQTYKSPLSFFLVATRVYLWYAVFFIIIYKSKLWQRFSILYKIFKKDLSALKHRKDFFNLKKNFHIIVLKKRYTTSIWQEKIILLAKERFKAAEFTRFSRNTFLLRSDINKLEFISFFSPFVSKLFYDKTHHDLERIAPLAFCFTGKVKPIIDVFSYLKKHKISFSFHKVKLHEYCRVYFNKTNRKLAISELAREMQNTDYIIPEKLIFKDKYLGIIPVFDSYKTGALKGFIELDVDGDYQLVIKILTGQIKT